MKTLIPKPKHAEKEGFIYLLRDNRDSVKIGVSIDVERRFSNLRIGNPSLYIYAKIPCRCYAFERFIHKEIKQLSVGGEWFSPAEEAIQKVLDMLVTVGHEYKAYYMFVYPPKNL